MWTYEIYFTYRIDWLTRGIFPEDFACACSQANLKSELLIVSQIIVKIKSVLTIYLWGRISDFLLTGINLTYFFHIRFFENLFNLSKTKLSEWLIVSHFIWILTEINWTWNEAAAPFLFYKIFLQYIL